MASAIGTFASGTEAPTRPILVVNRHHAPREPFMRRPPVRSGAHALRDGVRVVDGRLETAVWTLRHPKTGRTVSLVGTMHIADARYFGELSGIISELAADGAQVQVEGITHRDEDQLSGWEGDRLAEARRWEDPERAGLAVALLRLESQRLLNLPEGFRNIDLSHVDLLRRVGWDEYRRLFSPGPVPAAVPQFSPLLRAVLRFQLRHSRSIEALRSLSPRHRRVNRVVIDERNAVAFAGAAESLERTDVALVWGADHLPGLARLFGRAGYRLLTTRWVDACSV